MKEFTWNEETIEREWYERYNSGIPQWQAEYYK